MKVKKTWYKLTQSYILIIPFLSAFSLSPWLPLPLAFLVFISLIYLPKLLRIKLFFFSEDICIVLIVALGTVAMLFSLEYLGTKNITHLAAILISIFFFYFVTRSWLTKIHSIKELGIAFTVSLLLASIFTLGEFICTNLWGIHVPSIIPYSYPSESYTDALLVGNLIRPRGLADEAGIMALFYEMAIPLSLLYLREKPFIAIPYYLLLVLPAFVLLASTAAIGAVSIAVLTAILINLRKKWAIYLIIIGGLSLLIAINFDGVRLYIAQVLGKKLELFALDSAQQTSSSVIARTSAYLNALILSSVAPWGIGWGTASQVYSDGLAYASVELVGPGFISFYGEILVASGLIGLLLFLFFIIRKIIILARLKSFESQLILVSIISLSIHYAFISNYWYPMFWFSLALGDKLIKDRKHYRITSKSLTASL